MTVARTERDAMEWLADIVSEMESDEAIGIPPHVPLLIEALRGVLAAAAPNHADRRNPTKGLWDKRNTPSGHFEAVKRSGDVFKGVKREN